MRDGGFDVLAQSGWMVGSQSDRRFVVAAWGCDPVAPF